MVSKGVGWSTEANLLYEILKQLKRLSSGIGGSSTGSLKYQKFIATEGQSVFDITEFTPTDSYLVFIDYNAQSREQVYRDGQKLISTSPLTEGQVILIIN